MNQTNRFYLFITIILAIAVIAGGVMLAIKYSRSQPVKITLSRAAPPSQSGKIYITGDITNPGIYTLTEGDTIQTLLSDAGLGPDADLNYIKIYIPREGEKQVPQKIDINRAEAWLLEALPGIGEIIAQAIVDYRNENGSFQRIEDLLHVQNIGEKTLVKIKDYITVSD